MFEVGKRRAAARLRRVLPPHLLPDERVRVIAVAGGDHRSIRYWAPLAAIAGFAIWGLTRPHDRLLWWAFLLVAVWFVWMLQLSQVRWLVLTDRRFLVLKVPMPSGKGLDVERADSLRSDAIAGHFSGVLGRGFVYRTVGGRLIRFRIYSYYLPELAKMIELLRPAQPPPERPDLGTTTRQDD